MQIRIESHALLDPRLKVLNSELGIGECACIGLLVKLWHSTQEALITDASFDFLELIIPPEPSWRMKSRGQVGPPRKMRSHDIVGALLKAGYLRLNSDLISPQFDHNSALIPPTIKELKSNCFFVVGNDAHIQAMKTAKEKARRSALARWNSDAPSIATSIKIYAPSNAAPAPAPDKNKTPACSGIKPRTRVDPPATKTDAHAILATKTETDLKRENLAAAWLKHVMGLDAFRGATARGSPRIEEMVADLAKAEEEAGVTIEKLAEVFDFVREHRKHWRQVTLTPRALLSPYKGARQIDSILVEMEPPKIFGVAGADFSKIKVGEVPF